MRVCIHQPSYWPWLGLIDKISKSDVFVILDHVQANKASNQYRNMLLCNGKPAFVTLPVNYHLGIGINELEFTNDSWKTKHIEQIVNYYRKSPYLKEVLNMVSYIYESNQFVKPIDVIVETMKVTLQKMRIDVEIILSSDLSVFGHKGELVFDICQKLMADLYISGQGAKAYMDEELLNKFKINGIQIEWQHFDHPTYKQYGTDEFVSGLSCLDLFINDLPLSSSIFYKK